jgi:hypothetical protein
MVLKAIYTTLEEIPEQFQELYTERNGKFEFTGVEGVKTQADVDRVTAGAAKEREEHKKTKEKLAAFGDLDPVQAQKDLDEVAELRVRVEANKTGAIDEAKLEEIVVRRVAREKAPVERENARLKKENDELTATNGSLTGTITKGKVETAIRKAAEAAKVVPSAVEDLVVIGQGIFEVSEDGVVVTKDGVGATPGVGVDVYLTDMKDKRPHWWPASQGGGGMGDGRDSGGAGNNPWSAKHWNLTEQGKVVREKGMEKANQLAKSAGVHVGATGPVKKTAE